MFKRILCTAALLLIPIVAGAQNVVTNGTDVVGSGHGNARVQGIDATNGKYVNMTVDASGRLLTGNQFKSASTVVYSGSITVGTRNTTSPQTGAGLSPYLLGVEQVDKMWRVRCSSATDPKTPWTAQLWGSMDGSNYAPILRQSYTASGVFLNAGAGDTLQVKGRGASGTIWTNGSWMPLTGANGERIRFPYIVAVCSSDSLGGTNTVTLTVEIAGAQ